MPIPTCECISALPQSDKLDAIYCVLLTISESGGDTSQFVTLTGEQTVTDKTFTSPIINEILDANGNEQVIFTTVPSAVNEFTFENAATGDDPKIIATGGDTNIGIEFIVKGSGEITLTGPVVIAFSINNTAGGIDTGNLKFTTVGVGADTPVADGTYTVGLGTGTNGTITTSNGVIIAIQEATP